MTRVDGRVRNQVMCSEASPKTVFGFTSWCWTKGRGGSSRFDHVRTRDAYLRAEVRLKRRQKRYKRVVYLLSGGERFVGSVSSVRRLGYMEAKDGLVVA